jgi:hypothetical protein
MTSCCIQEIGSTEPPIMISSRCDLSIRKRRSTAKCCRDGALETQLAAIGRNVALIVQVKTGHETAPGRAFERARLEYAIGFLGVVPPDLVNGLAGKLAEKPSVEFSTDWTIAKLWVAEEPTNSGALSVTLQAALKFICARLASHTERKYADRLMFPDDLMQFFAWQARKATNAAE